MNDPGPFGLLAIAVGVAAVFVLVGAIPVLLARNLITRRPATTHLREWPLYVFSAALMIFVFVGCYLLCKTHGNGGIYSPQVAEHPDHGCFGVWLYNEKVLASAEEAEILGSFGHSLSQSRFSSVPASLAGTRLFLASPHCWHSRTGVGYLPIGIDT
jgi:hypothetical protein